MKPNIILRYKAQKKRSAFTLIEIMVATVIMVVLVGLVIQITSEVLKVWNRSSGRLSANAEARIALDLLTQDLETAVFRNNDKQWLRVEAPVDPGGPYTDQTVALKLFSPALDRQSGPGDICGIAYKLNFGPAYEGADDNIYALYRKVIDPGTTFNNLMGSRNEVIQDSLVGGEWDTVIDVQRTHYLAGNILEFKVLLYEDDGTGVANLLNADEDTFMLDGVDYAFGQNSNNPDLSVEDITNPLLYADIFLTVISDEGLELLQSVDEGRSGTGYVDDSDGTAAEKIVLEHGEVFTRRVNFLARPL